MQSDNRKINEFFNRINTYLDISVFSDELDESLKAIQKIAGQTEDSLDGWVLLVGFLNLFLIVFEKYSDELYKGDQECTESN